ncbi:MAG: chemotaxis protein CheW [Gammaproteobacteria bacterium]|nr:chemotaxis protein CheW [Gammaproteobacteria bacterium]
MASVSPIELLREIESKSLARKALTVAEQTRANEWRGVGFKVGNVELVVSMQTVVEVLDPIHCTTVPSSKNWFDGIANVRGQLVPISDLHSFLYGERRPEDRDTRVIVFRLANTVAGLTVSAVTGIRSFPEDSKDQRMAGVDESLKPFIVGCYHRAGDDYPIFDFNRLVSNERFMHITEATDQLSNTNRLTTAGRTASGKV